MNGRAMHEWILFIAGETVAVLMSGDHALDDHQLSMAIYSYTTCIR